MTLLPNYIGQRDALAPLLIAIQASRATKRPLPHSLFLGKPGTGKTALARAVAQELGGPFVYVNSATVKDADAIAQAALQAVGGVLLLDEVHALDRKQAESTFTLLDESTVTIQQPVMDIGWEYQWMQTRDEYEATGAPGHWSGPMLYEVPVQVQTRQTEPVSMIVGDVTVIGATTDEALLPPALYSRLSRLIVRLRPYTLAELAQIGADYAESLGLRLDGEAAVEIAKRSRKSPRRMKQLTERAGDYAIASVGYSEGATITIEQAEAALMGMGVDSEGLEEPHRDLLRILVESGGVSRTTLAQRMGIPPKNMELYWSDLAERGLVTIGRRHEATEEGEKVLV